MSRLSVTAVVCLGLVSALPWGTASGQTLSPVFTDDFRHGSTTGTTSIPGGTATQSFTSYDIASTKNATASTITSGTLRLTFAATTSGFGEMQAVFSSAPVRLTSLGDAINLQYTFVNTSNILSGTGATNGSCYLWTGLYDTGTAATPPLTTLASSGLNATGTTGNVTGGVQAWQGYVQRIAGVGGTTQSLTRPAQSGTTSANQDLVGNNVGGGAFNSPVGTTLTATGSTQGLPSQLVVGGTYTMDYTLTLVDSSTLSVRSYLYDGSGTAGTVLVSQTRLASGTALLTTQFSGLAFGVRYSGSSAGPIVMDVTSLSVKATNAPTPPPPSGITINVASGTQTQTTAGYPLLSGSQTLTKTGAGTLVLDQANTLTGSTTVQGGRLQLANGSALGASRLVPLAGGTVTLSPAQQTTVGGLAPSAGGLTDVGSGMVTVASGLTAAGMVSAIVTGMGDGSWNGTSGITSSVAATSGGDRTVGWLDNGDGSVTFAFAAAGDTNLDWQVDIIDAANFLAGGKFDSGSPGTWNEGDFTYDGFVDILDAASFLSNGLFDAGVYNTPAGGAGAVAAVPEPVSLPGFGMAAAIALALARRRKA
ncbi:MAG: autotransporter-associated beta strand repeat-containing protein [Planctomycetes bacterium]|nr:autotransporter-associated beta strand repeat-containing protein [Planctomycetota bacterium]